ncbi:MAG: amino acid ABC transporter permease [Eubacteriales bacterium]|nr:amino acid ABC transporter permease [Eubacteriales bacterium]
MRTFQAELVWKYLRLIIAYIPVTMKILVYSLLVAMIIGILAAVVRFKKIPVLSQIIRVLISYVRGTPVVTQLFIIYFGLPQILKNVGIDLTGIPGLWFVVITYGLNTGAAISENLRAALASVDKGQWEASHAIGLSGFQALRYIIMPQAMVVAVPNFSNIVVAALKNTSLAFAVGIVEMMTRAKLVSSSQHHLIEGYLAVAIIYYILYLILSFVFKHIEKAILRSIGGNVK